MEKLVYLDNAATTRVSKAALDAMLPFLGDSYGNPSSIYSVGRDAKAAIENARGIVAAAIGAQAGEIFFTGSGTEANNWALKSAVALRKDKGNHIITSAIEHPAVLKTAEYLQTQGCEVTYLGVDKFGQISLSELENAIREDTVLISIMTANNEIGTILPISEISKIAKARDVLLHTDAVQAAGSIPIDVAEMGVDMLTLSGHKLGAPKGVGVLFKKKNLKLLPPLIHGGGQEHGARSGTENVAGIAGLAAALNYRVSQLPQTKLAAKRDRLVAELLKIPRSALTGDPVNRLPGIASFVFEAIEGESMLLMLDHFGICGSSGSACSSGSLDPSHVLLAIGLPHEVAHGSLRLSLSEDTTDEEIDFVVEKLTGVVAKLRKMSPVWDGE
ncbi:MAG: aminotransferase class V-fold PLP-dependent enzyme [Oscillospiraceae bacterium]|nr:aminotransferase class V-fold PLP-dependent enzyme [Oscillospiraceae bacterium]